MKSFFSFLSEARSSQASEQAQKLKLTGDGHGQWYDKDGKLVARTVAGKLEMLDQKQIKKEEEPAQEKKPAAPITSNKNGIRIFFMGCIACFGG